MNALKPLTIETAPEGSKQTLQAIQKGFGFIPNLMATFANSPAVLNGYMGLDAAWETSSLSAKERHIVLLPATAASEAALPGIAPGLLNLGVMLPTTPATRFQPDAAAVQSHWRSNTRGVVLASPSNPTGTSIAPAELQAIAETVHARGGVTIVDEI